MDTVKYTAQCHGLLRGKKSNTTVESFDLILTLVGGELGEIEIGIFIPLMHPGWNTERSPRKPFQMAG